MGDKLFDRNQYCQGMVENDFPKLNMCYVKLPSNCLDLKNSTRFLGLQMSEKACSQLQKESSNQNRDTKDCKNCIYQRMSLEKSLY